MNPNPPTLPIHNKDKNTFYNTINEAITDAHPGNTICITEGTYFEHLNIDKSIILTGDNKKNTIIDGSSIGTVIQINADNVQICNLTIQNSGTSTIFADSGIKITGGIVSSYHDIEISNNIIANNKNGVYIDLLVTDSIIKENIITQNYGIGVRLGILSDDNQIYHNNFIENTFNARDLSTNLWDNNYPNGGNYWDTYDGVDEYCGPDQDLPGIDGIGDTRYVFDGFHWDFYPLMNPYQPTISIISSYPPDGAIDARIPHNPDNPEITYGWDTIELTFDGDVSSLSTSDFSVTEIGGYGVAPTIISMNIIGNDTVEIVLSEPIEPVTWTIISHEASDTSVRLGYLPGDVDSSKCSTSNDIAILVDALRGTITLPEYSTNIDRSIVSDSNDIIELIDLLNGTGEYDPWNNVALPPLP